MNGSNPYISAESANQVQRLSSVLGNSVADLVTDVGVQINTWNNAQSADTAVLKNLNEQRNQVSGVNLDEEAANLLKYQQLYSASSKVLQTGNQMFNALISIMN
jgi:flagellar hook-associated protein 1 FlgK